MRWQLPGRWAGAKASDFLRRRSGHAAGADHVWPAIREAPWREPAPAPRSPGWLEDLVGNADLSHVARWLASNGLKAWATHICSSVPWLRHLFPSASSA